MKTFSSISLFVFALVTLFGTDLANGDQGLSDSKSPSAPSGYLLFEEENWYLLADEPGLHVERSRDAFLKSDLRTAAKELRKAAVHLKTSSTHSIETSKRKLVHAAHDLERAADRIESGTLKSVDEFDTTVSHAMQSLSEYQYRKAVEAWAKRETRQAGHYLRAAADNLERATARTEARMKAATTEVTRESRVISRSMVEGTGIMIDDVGKGLERMGHQIEHVGLTMLPSTKPIGQ
jgi:hypothetical protein